MVFSLEVGTWVFPGTRCSLDLLLARMTRNRIVLLLRLSLYSSNGGGFMCSPRELLPDRWRIADDAEREQ